MTKPTVDDRSSRLIVSVAVVLLVFALALLVAHLDDDVDDTGHRCHGYAAGTVDPVTCVPYAHGHGHGYGGAAAHNAPRSSARRPGQPSRPKAPLAKVPAPPKAPVVKAPPARPRVSLRK